MMPAVQSLHADSNVLLRYLTGDPSDMAKKARELFVQVREGRITLILEEIVVAETVWVLQSFYRRSKKEIQERMAELLSSDGIECPDRDVLSRALFTYAETSVKFGDALLAAHMQHQGAEILFSFDQHFDRIPGIRRLVPGETP